MKKTKSKVTILVIIGIILIAAFGSLAWRYFYPISNVNSNTKKLSDGTVVTDRTDTSYSNQSPDRSQKDSNVSVTITQVSQDSNQLVVRALVNSAKTGECTLTLTNGLTTITKIGVVTAGPSYFYCNGFVINKSELTQKGIWQIDLKVSSEGKNSSVTQEVTVE